MSPLVSQKHILTNCHIRNQSQLLMDNHNPFSLTVFDFIKFAYLSVINDIPFIRTIRIDTA